MLDHPHRIHSINLQQVLMLNCMQKINFTIRFFLKILQRNSKLLIFGNLDMPGHTHLKWLLTKTKTFDNYQQTKNNFILHVFLAILQRYCKLVILGTLGIPGYVHPKWYYQLIEIFVFIFRQKINFIPHAFLEILSRYANLFRVLWACWHAWSYTTKNDSINL